MKRIQFILLSFLVGVALSACRYSPEGLDASVTDATTNVLSTQTAEALTSSYSSTPDPQLKIRSIPTASPPTTPLSDSPLLFFDDFSDPNSGWDEYSDADGENGYSNGSYRVMINSTSMYSWVGINRTFSDVIIDVDAQQIGGPDYNEFGVTCRVKDDDNFYLFVIGSDGYFGIAKKIDNKWIDLSDSGGGFNENVIKVEPNMNHIKVTCNYEELILEVNGSILIEVADPDLRAGDVGLYVATFDEPGVEILFDNFVVTKP